MKPVRTLSLIVAVGVCGLAGAQTSGTKDPDVRHCMNKKGKDMQKCNEMRHSGKAKDATKFDMTHKATGIVKAVDPVYGSVMIEQGAVASLHWPAMTMSYVVKDKALFDKLVKGAKVKVEFMKEKADYVITLVLAK